MNLFTQSLLRALGVLLVLCSLAILVLLCNKPIRPIPSTDIKIGERAELEKRAESGDPVAQYELTLFVDDPIKISALLKKAAESGYAPAVVTYATSIMDDNEISANQARKMLESVAIKGYYPAIIELTHCISQGDCGPASIKDALSWAIASRLLLERKLIKQNALRQDEESLRRHLSLSDLSVAEEHAQLIVKKIPKVTDSQ
jgi:hypothetical protein